MSVYTTFKAYLDAAQTAFAAGSYDACRVQLVLAEIELAKIPDVENQGEKATFRTVMATVRAAITDVEARAGSRRNTLQFATLTPAATGPGEDDE